MKLRLVTALLLLLAACGGDSTESTTPAAPAETTEAPVETTAAPTTEAVASGQLVAVSASDLGDILVDGEGRTLYLFEPDAQGASTCYDSCESNWPPLVGGASAGDGVDGSLLGTASRDDGSEQVTYDGWPLYYFAGDAAAGDTNGQGINDVWYVVSAAGGAVEADAAAEAAGSAY